MAKKSGLNGDKPKLLFQQTTRLHVTTFYYVIYKDEMIKGRHVAPEGSGLKPDAQPGPFCVEFAFSPCVSVFFLGYDSFLSQSNTQCRFSVDTNWPEYSSEQRTNRPDEPEPWCSLFAVGELSDFQTDWNPKPVNVRPVQDVPLTQCHLGVASDWIDR